MLLSILIGYLIGVPLTYFLTRKLLRTLADRMVADEQRRRWIRLVGGILATLAVAPAIFAGVIFVGYMGQRPENAAANAMGAGDLFMIGIGLALGTLMIVAIAAVMGAFIGLQIARGMNSRPAS